MLISCFSTKSEIRKKNWNKKRHSKWIVQLEFQFKMVNWRFSWLCDWINRNIWDSEWWLNARNLPFLFIVVIVFFSFLHSAFIFDFYTSVQLKLNFSLFIYSLICGKINTHIHDTIEFTSNMIIDLLFGAIKRKIRMEYLAVGMCVCLEYAMPFQS